MSYIGSPPASQFFAPGTDTFSGTGSQTAFTLSRNVGTVNDILVIVNNVEQQPSNYTVASNILTFSPAPSAGTNNIYVRYLSTNLITIAPQQGSVFPSSLSTPNALYWDTSGNVGVGTSSPTTTLTVSGTNNANTLYAIDLNNTPDVAGNGAGIRFNQAGNLTNYIRSFFTGGGWGLSFGSTSDIARITSSGNLQFNSGYGSVATAYGCRAWVNFNGTGTVAIRGSGNVTSITDNGVGDYTLNITTALPDTNYAVVACGENNRIALNNTSRTNTTTAVNVLTRTVADANGDSSIVAVSVFR